MKKGRKIKLKTKERNKKYLENFIEGLKQIQLNIQQSNKIDPKSLLENLTKTYQVEHSNLVEYYDLIASYESSKKTRKISSSGQPVWTDEERSLFGKIYNDLKGIAKRTDAFRALSKLNNRTYSSNQFHFYNNKELVLGETITQPKKQSITVKEKDVEPKPSNTSSQNKTQSTEQPPIKKQNEDELLSSIQSILGNMSTLKEFDLENFFSGLSKLSTLAVEKNGNSEELYKLKEESKIIKNENELLKTKLELLKKEIETFESQDTIQKITRLKDFGSNLIDLIND